MGSFVEPRTGLLFVSCWITATPLPPQVRSACSRTRGTRSNFIGALKYGRYQDAVCERSTPDTKGQSRANVATAVGSVRESTSSSVEPRTDAINELVKANAPRKIAALYEDVDVSCVTEQEWNLAVRSLYKLNRLDLAVSVFWKLDKFNAGLALFLMKRLGSVVTSFESLTTSASAKTMKLKSTRPRLETQPPSGIDPGLARENIMKMAGASLEDASNSKDGAFFLQTASVMARVGEFTLAKTCLVRAKEIGSKGMHLHGSGFTITDGGPEHPEEQHQQLMIETCNTMIRRLGKAGRLELIFLLLDAMHACGISTNNESYEFLANAAVRKVEFLTGAVSMETLPERTLPEAMFVGRSNVGKSSLVNMVLARKFLAHTSKRPGKTQQFNYFLVNDDAQAAPAIKTNKRALRRRELGHSAEQAQAQRAATKALPASPPFYIVDSPGVGYAKVSRPVQDSWKQFMRDFLTSRESLRLLFHLVDGRHGPLADDEELSQIVAALSRSGQFMAEYVIVLTKMDKTSKGRAKPRVVQSTRDLLEKNGLQGVPIVSTSSETRLGRDDMWRILSRAIKSSGE
ncbi:putative GTP-binding protein EngB [Porphyridium purpureum]|uniref:Putative GTP-binding protein EngB n=1 Tax=Porphyridium purpureum TaxID=35688 RepID=A0A5J4Z606_PORPP|nr:putative GTP-binding protein EngB [Porphyridium purpureum]|eukprot:POR4279..scf295_1